VFHAASTRAPFQPLRNTLYAFDELMAGFAADDPLSLMRSVDFRSFHYFVVHGRTTPTKGAGKLQAVHDSSILRATWDHLAAARRPAAAILGGHGEARGSPTYMQVASIAKRLTEQGFLVASGGGPGCMEASHLGALLAGRSSGELADAAGALSVARTLPDARAVVQPSGAVDLDLVAALHRWATPAVALMNKYGRRGGESLAIPTWHHGHEPSSPLATHVAKYFVNSIREDVLLALASGGMVFSPGRAGTLQEVFQAAAQNYYDRDFAPMVFWDERFWTEDLPVRPLLEGLFVRLSGMPREQFAGSVLITSDVDEAVAFLQQARRLERRRSGPRRGVAKPKRVDRRIIPALPIGPWVGASAVRLAAGG
jgi:predicted Rossmann-fold nucleotide-binding protein